jgi:hypothetical protein
MIVAVTWQYTILELGSATAGYRIARRAAAGYTPPRYQSGVDTLVSTPRQFTPDGNTWHRGAPSPIHYPPAVPYPNGFDYDFCFWSISAHDVVSMNTYASIVESANVTETFIGGAWVITANAYYFRNFDDGSGDEALFVDMFDITASAFVPPDFVDVTPDPTGALTAAGNNGYIDTGAQIAAGVSNRITVAARDQVGIYQFDHWLSVPTLRHAGDSSLPPLIGQPDPHDLVIGHNDDVTAFAFYNEVPLKPPREPWLYNPWWWIETHGGRLPGPTPGPWTSDIAAALALTNTAEMVSPAMRASVLRLAIEQLSHASTAITKAMRAPEGTPTRGGIAKATKARSERKR